MKGLFITDWKLEDRSVIPKADKDTYHHENDYRTIAITALLGKRFEYITCNRLKMILEAQNFDMKQFAYLEKRSATQASVSVIDKVQKGVNVGKVCGVVFYDFTDAFGTVNRLRLISKLKNHFNIEGRLMLHELSWVSVLEIGWIQMWAHQQGQC